MSNEFRSIWPRLRAAALGLTVFFVLSPSIARAGIGVELTTDFHFSYHLSRRMPGEQFGADGLAQRDFAFSYRPRFYVELMERNGRTIRFLIGPYFRITSLVFPRNYGVDIQGPFSYEFGGDVGISWFGIVRTLFSGSPQWDFTYVTTDLFAPDTTRPVRLTYRHWSAGLRFEVPIYTLSNMPDDRRAEFGLFAMYQLDRIEKITVEPAGFVPDGSEDPNPNQELNFTQQIGQRWQAGLFMNIRI